MGPIGCPETSVTNYQHTLRNIPEKQRPFAAAALTQASQYLNLTLPISPKFYKSSLIVEISQEELLLIPSTYHGSLIILQTTILTMLHNMYVLRSFFLCAILYICFISLETSTYKPHKYSILRFAVRRCRSGRLSPLARETSYATLAWNVAMPSGQMMPCSCYISQILIWGHRPRQKYVICIPRQHHRDCWQVDLTLASWLFATGIKTFNKAAFCAQSAFMCFVLCPNKQIFFPQTALTGWYL
jgi:hypothetical protein